MVSSTQRSITSPFLLAYTPIQGAPFFLSVTLPSLLNYADKGKKPEEGPHQSQKMICFTDSRQGTARLAVKLQQNSERNSFRSILLHTVALLTEQTTNNSSEIETLREAYKQSPNPLILQLIQTKESSVEINTTNDKITEDKAMDFDRTIRITEDEAKRYMEITDQELKPRQNGYYDD